MKNTILIAAALSAFLISSGFAQTAPASEQVAVLSADKSVEAYVRSLVATYDRPGTRSAQFACNAPFAGNGGLRVVLLGTPDAQTFHINADDMWTDGDAKHNLRARAITTGGVTISADTPATAHTAPFAQEQHLWDAELVARSTAGFTTRTIVSSSENTMVTELATESDTPIPVMVSLWAPVDNRNLPGMAGTRDGVMWASRETFAGPRWVSRTALCTRLIGTTAEFSAKGNGTASGKFTLTKGTKIFVVTTLEGGRGAVRPQDAAIARALAFAAGTPEKLRAENQTWWHRFWTKTWLRTYDEVYDKAYFGGLYLMASVNRAGHTPAGQYPLCVTDNPGWGGDFHMNQEHLGQFCWGYSGNRPEIVGNACQPLVDYIPRGMENARTRMHEVGANLGPRKGILFPVGLVPGGFSPIYLFDGRQYDGAFLNQVSDASYTGALFIWNYEYNQDRKWLKETGYPFLRLLGDFWESHLEWDGARFVSYGATLEKAYAKNSINDLALARRVLGTLIAFSEELGVDADKRPVWRHIADHLAELPTTTIGGKRVFVQNEGSKKTPGSVDFESPIFPSDVIGLNSPEEQRRAAIDTFDIISRGWKCPKLGVCGARIGYPADALFDAVKKGSLTCRVDDWMGLRQNFTIGDFHGTGEILEFLQTAMLQSRDRELRFFPSRRTGKPASFHNLRAQGAFLVSAELKDGVVSGVTILSEKGRDCVVLNPWPGRNVRVTRNGTVAETFEGERFPLKTKENETLALNPQ